MTSSDKVMGGWGSVARVSAAEQDIRHREDQRRAALAYLTRTGNDDPDVLGALGLDGWDPTRVCANPGCGRPFLPTRRGQASCSGACAQAVRAAKGDAA